MTDDHSGKRFLVTGASRGIGAACARLLAERGAQLVLAARDRDALCLLKSQCAGGPHEAIALDVSDELAWNRARSQTPGIDALDGIVIAAGILTPIGPLGTWTVEEFRRTIEVNVVGTLITILAGIDSLKRSHGSVVTFSGGGATAPFPRFDAYATSKAAVVRLTENLAVDLLQEGVRLNSVAPGFVVTEMHAKTMEAGPELVGNGYFERTREAVAEQGGDSPDLPTELVSFLLGDRSQGITGKLLSARWDPWQESSFQERLRTEKNLATLRRIDDEFFTSLGNAT